MIQKEELSPWITIIGMMCISYECKLVRQEVYAGIHIMHLFAPYRILIFFPLVTMEIGCTWVCQVYHYATEHQHTLHLKKY